MSDTSIVPGGQPIPSLATVAADQSTITGSGTSADPLHAERDALPVVVDGSTIIGDGTSLHPLAVRPVGLADLVPVATDGVTAVGDGTQERPITVITGGGGGAIVADEVTLTGFGTVAVPVALKAVQHDATLAGAGAVGSPLGVVPAALAGGVPVRTDTSLTGNGTDATPLAVVPAALDGEVAARVSAPITGDGTTATPLGLDFATLATDLADLVPVQPDGITIVGNGTTGNPLVALASAGTTIYFNVKAYGAIGNGVADDTTAIRAAVTAAAAVGGGTVYFPDGTYLISEHAGSQQCISVTNNNISFLGQSRNAVVFLAANQRNSVRMFYCGPNITNLGFYNLTLNGNRPNQPDQTGLQHYDAIFLDRCSFVTIENVEIFQPAASCVVLFTNTNNVLVSNCYLHAGGWMGVVAGDPGGQFNVTVRDSWMTQNASGLHLETDQASSGWLVEGCTMDSSANGNPAVSISGHNGGDVTLLTQRVVLNACTITGMVNIQESIGARLTNCDITCNDTAGLPALKVTGQVIDFIATACRIVLGAAATSPRAIWLAGDNFKIFSDVNLVNCDIYVNSTAANGVDIQQAESASVRGGSINGNAVMTAGHYGINVTSSVLPSQGIIQIKDVTVVDFTYGVAAQSLGSITCANLEVCGCTFDAVTAGVMTAGMSLDLDGRHSVQAAICIGNELAGNVATMFATYPQKPFLIGGNRGGVGIYSAANQAAIVNSLVAPIGSQAMQRDTGVTWINTTGLATGWHSINVT